MSEDTQKFEKLKNQLITYISTKAEDEFNKNGKNYLEQFNKIFNNSNLLDQLILQYLDLIKDLPDTKFYDLTETHIQQLAGKIIRSIIPQLDELRKTDKKFVIDKSFMVFAGQDVLDYTYNSSPTLKLRFSMIYNSLFNKGNPENKLKLLSPIRDNFNFQDVATVLQQPKESSEVVDALKMFSQEGLDEDKIEIAAHIFAGIIAKLAGKKSPFAEKLSRELIIAAQKKAIELAMLCSQEHNPIFSVKDREAAINLGKAFGKATRNQLYQLSQKSPKPEPGGLQSVDLQKHYYDILTSNYQESLDLLNKPTPVSAVLPHAVLSTVGVAEVKLPFPPKAKESLTKILIPHDDKKYKA